MRYEIEGTTLPILTIILDKGEAVYSRSGVLVELSELIEIRTILMGGFAKAVRRLAGKETMWLMKFFAKEDGARVSFSEGNVPGATKAFYLEGNNDLICERASFLCAEMGADMDITFLRRVSAGLFGGGGFIFLRLSGKGYVFLHPFGEIKEHVLAEGENVLVAHGKVVAFESSVDYRVIFMPGAQNICFSNQGLFLVKLTGPGRVLVQSTITGKAFMNQNL